MWKCGWLPGCCLDALNGCFAVSRVFLGCFNVVDGSCDNLAFLDLV